MILYHNEFYKVTKPLGINTYHVINKFTNVVEDTTNKLPTAVGSAIALEAALKRLMERAEGEKSTD